MKRIISDLFVLLAIVATFFIGFYCCQITSNKQENDLIEVIKKDSSVVFEIKDSKFRNLENTLKPHEIIEPDWPENQKPFFK